ncbi:MAG TPA: proton-conducting transporter membrane subunit [Candidatus Baltobacteraceae bacterium]|nr:proton-conducting transporter membrane subunit [Candidatus Baltobacteraceae bacterium]
MNSGTAGQLATLCVALPLMAAASLAPFTKHAPRWVSCTVASTTALAVMVVGCMLTAYTFVHGPAVYWMGGWLPRHELAIGISFSVDAFGAALTAFIALLVLAASIYTWIAFDLTGTLFHTLLLAFLGAMCGYALTGDMFNMFVWFELMTAAAIALTAHKIEEAVSIEGSINLAVTNAIAGFVVLLGIALLYGRTDALNFAQLSQVLAQRPADALVLVAFALIVTGYFVKGAVAPFHFWLDDAHAVAPTPICILFSGIMVQVALYGVARMYWTVFAVPLHPYTHQMKALFLGVGIATALVGAVMAFAQRHLKRLLAFSTVSHSGMFVAVFGLFDASGMAAAALFVLAHGLVKGALFTCAGNYLNRFRSLDEEVLGGKGRQVLFNSLLFLIGGLALAGMPPFAISAAKVLYEAALKDHGLFSIALCMGAASALDAGAVLRAGLHITFDIGKAQRTGISPREEESECEGDHLERTPWTMLAVPAMLVLIALVLGMSGAFRHGVEQAARAFCDRNAYVAAVLHNAPVGVPPAPWQPRTTEDIVFNVCVSFAAIVAAFMGLYRDHIPQYLSPVFGPPLRALRDLHSGIFTDYVAYMVFGIAAYSLWLAMAVR